MFQFDRTRPIVVATALCCAIFALAKLAAIGRAWGEVSRPDAADKMLATPSPSSPGSPSPSPTCVPAYSVLNNCAPFIAATTDIGNHCDDCSTTITLPFPVRLYENLYTQVTLHSNGAAYFPGPGGFGCLPHTGVTNVIYPYSDDLMTVDAGGACAQYTGGHCGIFTRETVNAGQRAFTIEWRTVYFENAAQRANFELRFLEGETFFDVIYGVVDRGNTTMAGVQHDPEHFTQAFCGGGRPAAGDHWYVLQGCGISFPSPTPFAGPGCGGGTTPTPPQPTPTPTPSQPPPSPTPPPPVTPTPGLTTVQFSSAAYRDDESHTAIITVTRTFPDFLTSSVDYATSNGTALGGASCGSNVDYISTSGTLIFTPGVASRTFSVVLCADTLTEPDETINLALSNPVAATLGVPNTAVLTINDTATQFRNSSDIVINTNLPADLYPSTITVSGAPTFIGSMRVTLYDYSSEHPLTTGVLLVSPGGVKFILMAGVGGVPMNMPVTLNLTDTAGQVMPANGTLATADYEPTSWIPVVGYAPPAPPPPYNLPGHDVGGTGTETFIGNFGGTNANGVWSLYVRDLPPPPIAPEIVAGHIAGGWGIEFFQPTAAQASLAGRVMTAGGAGIRNATVVVTGNSLPTPRVVTTGSFGYFSFEGLTVGETYVVTVSSQRYTFTTPSRVITLVDNITDADFIADQ